MLVIANKTELAFVADNQQRIDDKLFSVAAIHSPLVFVERIIRERNFLARGNCRVKLFDIINYVVIDGTRIGIDDIFRKQFRLPQFTIETSFSKSRLFCRLSKLDTETRSISFHTCSSSSFALRT